MTALHPRVKTCRVISLPGRSRLAGFFDQDGSDRFEVFRAVDGYAGEADSTFDYEKFTERTGWHGGPGEAGCAVSHYRLIEEFAHSDDVQDAYLLVMEDDARFHEDFVSVVNSIARDPRDLGIVVLGGPDGRLGSWPLTGYAETLGQVSLWGKWFRGTSGAVYRCGHIEGAAYSSAAVLYSRDAAQRICNFVERSGGVPWLADEFVDIARLAQVDLNVLRPPIIDFVGQSVIDRGRSPFLWNEAGFLNRSWKERIALRTRARSLRGIAVATGRDLLAMRGRPHKPKGGAR